MATWPAKTNYATGDVLTATQMNDIGGELNDLYTSSGFAAGKNKIINGDFGIWQRGTSFNNNGGTYTADRWVITGSGTAPTLSQQTFTPATAPVAGYEGQYYARWDQSSAATAAQTFQHRIEDVRTLAGQTATISFWAKANLGSTAPDLKISQNFGTGGSTAVTTTVQASISFTASWVRYSYSIAVPSISGKTIGTGSNLQVYLQFPTSGTWQHDYWGFQIEAGSTATPFQTATGTKQGELAACQRYYFRAGGNSAYSLIGQGAASATTRANIQMLLPVPLRTNPTAVDYSTIALQSYDGQALNAATSIAISGLIGVNNVGLQVDVASGLTAGSVFRCLTDNSTSGYVGLSAEL